MSDSGNPAAYAFPEVLEDATITFVTVKGLEAINQYRKLEELPLPHLGNEPWCGWYPEDEEAAVPAKFCDAPPIWLGNGVSGPGFIPFCREHGTAEMKEQRWGFEMWALVPVDGELLLELTQTFHRS